MPAFLPEPDSTPAAAAGPARGRGLLLVSAAIAALATMQPWIQVRFVRLFGEHSGPPGWQTSAGFTCLCTCALVAVMALAETPSRSTWQAVRPASTMLVAVSALAVALQWWDGPGQLRGVTAAWTFAFWFAAAGTAALLACCVVRGRPAGRRPALDQSSSGPPT
ncbi:MAG: hypothetical protein WAT39_14815 [Planctomycetota bacterium]